MPVINRLAEKHAEMTGWRHQLHAYPELCYEEEWTADFVAARLAEFGLEVHRGLGKTGLVGVLRGSGDSQRAIGLRADMDALPMQEANEFSHKSKIDGRMHACGHDGHTTMLLGAAAYLAETRNFDGTVYFIFQPAEEGGAGGQAMIDDGLFEKFQMDTVWGLHNWPGLEVGKIAVHRGPCMASADMFTLTISGRGSHAAMPHQSADPVLAAAAIIQTLQMIVSRRTDPMDPAVVSVTQVNGGTAHNIIPDKVSLCGTARAVRPETRARLEADIAEIAAQVAKAHGCSAEMVWRKGYPPTVNHLASAERAAGVAATLVGDDQLVMDPPASMGAEDFSFLLGACEGAYIWLGAGPAEEGRMLHNTGYDFNDEILPLGASYWAQLVEAELPRR